MSFPRFLLLTGGYIVSPSKAEILEDLIDMVDAGIENYNDVVAPINPRIMLPHLSETLRNYVSKTNIESETLQTIGVKSSTPELPDSFLATDLQTADSVSESDTIKESNLRGVGRVNHPQNGKQPGLPMERAAQAGEPIEGPLGGDQKLSSSFVHVGQKENSDAIFATYDSSKETWEDEKILDRAESPIYGSQSNAGSSEADFPIDIFDQDNMNISLEYHDEEGEHQHWIDVLNQNSNTLSSSFLNMAVAENRMLGFGSTAAEVKPMSLGETLGQLEVKDSSSISKEALRSMMCEIYLGEGDDKTLESMINEIFPTTGVSKDDIKTNNRTATMLRLLQDRNKELWQNIVNPNTLDEAPDTTPENTPFKVFKPIRDTVSQDCQGKYSDRHHLADRRDVIYVMMLKNILLRMTTNLLVVPRYNQILTVLLLGKDSTGEIADGKSTGKKDKRVSNPTKDNSNKSISLAELPTGQGKTFVAAITAIFLKFWNRIINPRKSVSIGILTSNKLLSWQSYMATKDIFQLFEKIVPIVKLFQEDSEVGSNSGEDAALKAIQRGGSKNQEKGPPITDVIYLSPFELARDHGIYYKNKFGSNARSATLDWHKEVNVNDPNFESIIVIDEVDAVLFDGVGETYLSTNELPFARELASVAKRIAKFSDGLKAQSVASTGENSGETDQKPKPAQGVAMITKIDDFKRTLLAEVREHSPAESKSGPPSDQFQKLVKEIVANLSKCSSPQKLGTTEMSYDHCIQILGKQKVDITIAKGERFFQGFKEIQAKRADFIGCDSRMSGSNSRDTDISATIQASSCDTYKRYVESQVDRWIGEGVDLISSVNGGVPSLVEGKHYLVDGMGLCMRIHRQPSPNTPEAGSLPFFFFGSDQKCKEALSTALYCGPNGRDSNYDEATQQQPLAKDCVTQWLEKWDKAEEKAGEKGVKLTRRGRSLKQDQINRLTNYLEITKGGVPEKKTGIGASPDTSTSSPDAENVARDKIFRQVSYSMIYFVDHTSSGLIRDKMRFNGFKHSFLEWKHNEGQILFDPTSETLALSRIRSMEGFDKITGMTGTLPREGEAQSFDMLEFQLFQTIMKHLYGGGVNPPSLSYIPGFAQSRLSVKGSKRVENHEEQMNNTIQEGLASPEEEKCTLIVTSTIRNAYRIAEKMKSENGKLKEDNQKAITVFIGTDAEQSLLGKTYGPKDVVITTAAGSRGVDWQCGALNGFEVVATHIPFSKRIQRQIQGRAARCGKPGSYFEILREEEWLKSQGLQLAFLWTKIAQQILISFTSDLQTDIVTMLRNYVKRSVQDYVKKNVPSDPKLNEEKITKQLHGKIRLWLTDSRVQTVKKFAIQSLHGGVVTDKLVEGTAQFAGYDVFESEIKNPQNGRTNTDTPTDGTGAANNLDEFLRHFWQDVVGDNMAVYPGELETQINNRLKKEANKREKLVSYLMNDFMNACKQSFETIKNKSGRGDRP